MLRIRRHPKNHEEGRMAKEKKQQNHIYGGALFFRLLYGFALPVLGALVLQAAYGAVDLLVVGQFGDASSISAVGTGSAFMQMVTFIITSLAMGATVVIGQHIGEKSRRNPVIRSAPPSYCL